jgi:nicotinate-nucleotide adenylyltransferase
LSEDGLRQRVAIYGGTFDPIHNGHWQVARAILKAFAMDRLIFVPAFVPPHKRDQQISSAFHRLAMLAIATADEDRMFVSTIEVEAPERPTRLKPWGDYEANLRTRNYSL